MPARPVEWVLVVFYGPEAHRAAYGRQVDSNRYTKDYIQLSRDPSFSEDVEIIFGVDASKTASVPLTYRWPGGNAYGELVFKSSDRPHLKWETSSGSPQVWKMSPAPSESTAETLPGDPYLLDFAGAEGERLGLARRGAGQPYLMAIKLQGQPRTLHLRVYLSEPKKKYAWANLLLAPQEVQDLASSTRQTRALAWSTFQSGGVLPNAKVASALSKLNATLKIDDTLDIDTGRALAAYLRNPAHGLFFDPAKNHDGWIRPPSIPQKVAASVGDLLKALDGRFPPLPDGDALAETLETDPILVESFKKQIEENKFGVPDTTATVKTRGSAQKAFADAVKANYQSRCAITGIATKTFLVAAHIVPWSKDQSIRLDPTNGICLSLLVDRAFEKGYLTIEDDYTVRIDWGRIGKDKVLRSQLKPYDNRKLTPPIRSKPKAEYLQRRRALVVPSE